MIPTETWVLPRPSRSKFPGSFPLHFERRLWRLLGEPERVLQPFGGCAEIGDTVDLNGATSPTWVGDAHDLDWIPDATYDLVLCDPPYSDEESYEIYAIEQELNFTRWTSEAVRVTRPGGYVAIYHVRQPPRPAGTRLVRRVVILTRTWHTARICFVFERLP